MSENYYFIKSQLNGYVLDVKDNSTKPATQVIVYPQKESGADNQLWGITSEGLIKSKLNGYVLDIEGSSRAAGARVIVYPKNEPSGTPNQQWTIQNGLIISKLNGYVLDIEGSSQAPGASVIVYPQNGEHGTANQLWDLVAEVLAAPEVVSSNTVKPSQSDEQSESTEADTTANSPNEVIEVQGNKLIETLKGIIGRDNVSRVIVYWANGDKLLDIPYAAGLTVTALVTLFLAPVTALTPFVLLLGRFKIEIVRPEGKIVRPAEEATSTPEAEAEATSQETEATSTEAEAEAETEAETEAEAEAEAEVEVEAEVESKPAAPAEEPESEQLQQITSGENVNIDDVKQNKPAQEILSTESSEQGPEILSTGGDNQLYTRETLTSKWQQVPNSGSVMDVTVFPAGKILGIGMNNHLYTRETLTSKWQHIPDSGSVIAITILPDGKILGAGTNNHLYTRETLTSKWQHIPNSGAVMSVTVLPDGKIVGVGMKNQLWYRDTLTSGWVNVPNSGSVTSITALPDGKIVGVGMKHELWYRETLTSKWQHIPNSGSPRTITYGGNVKQNKQANQQPSKGPVDLWQIGKPGTRGKEFSASGGWRKVFDYTVETDADPIGSPNAPRIITVPGLKSKPKQPSTDQLNIHFTLERDYAEGDCTLFYDWYGSETDTLTLDGQLLKEIQGKGEGKLQQSVLPLPALSSGQHTLTITTKGGRGGNHWIDYLKLASSGEEPEKDQVKNLTNGANVNQDNVKQNKIEPDIFSTGSKIALQADTGKWFSRCNGCQQTVGDNPDTITVHVEQPTSAPYAQFEVVNMGDGKIALKADTGKYVARCRGCIVRGAKPDSVTVHVTDPSAAYAQFTPELLENGKYALKADTGQYVARCNGCSPTATTPDTVTIHVDDPQGAPYAQWNIISISS